MSKQHGIAWLNIPGYKGESLNVVSGCTPASSGCRSCYAREMISRFAGMKGWPASPDMVTLFPERMQQPYRWKKPRAIFVPSMGDLFHKDVPWNFQYKVFEMMMHCPQHIFIILTKRADIMRTRVGVLYLHLLRNYPEMTMPIKNVWLGVSAETQGWFDERVSQLIHTCAAQRIVSIEPQIEEINASGWFCRECGKVFKHSTKAMKLKCPHCGHGDEHAGLIHRPLLGRGTISARGANAQGVSWLINGGESSNRARPFDPEWARKLRGQCKQNGVPYFFKQMSGATKEERDRIPEDLMVREFPI